METLETGFQGSTYVIIIMVNTTAIRSWQNGWTDQDRPLVFLFLGSSGVGMMYYQAIMRGLCNTREILSNHNNTFNNTPKKFL